MYAVLSTLLQSIHNQVLYLNGSKIFAGIVIITLNLCSRFANLKMSKTSEAAIKTPITRYLLIFAISWMGTREIYNALILTALFILLFDFILNEESEYCAVPEKYKLIVNEIDTNNDGIVTEEEISAALATLSKADKERKTQKQRTAMAMFHSYASAPISS
jgi:hypothetical protein